MERGVDLSAHQQYIVWCSADEVCIDEGWWRGSLCGGKAIARVEWQEGVQTDGVSWAHTDKAYKAGCQAGQ